MAKRKLPKGARVVSPGRIAVERAGARAVAKRVAGKPCESGPVRVMFLWLCDICPWRPHSVLPCSVEAPSCDTCGARLIRIPGEIHETIG